MITKTRIITFPRSGHHLLVRGLQWALTDHLVYSEFYNSPHNMENCPFVNLQKSHDFDLTDLIDDDSQYIIQIRGYELAAESWYRIEPRDETLEQFRDRNMAYFDGFMQKWVLSPPKNSIIITYEDMVSDKLREAIRAFKFLASRSPNDYELTQLKKWEMAEMKKKSFIFAPQ